MVVNTSKLCFVVLLTNLWTWLHVGFILHNIIKNHNLFIPSNEDTQNLFCHVTYTYKYSGSFSKYKRFFVGWMLRKFKDLSPKMVRMYGSSMESSDFQIPGRDYMGKTSCRDSKPDPELESVTLHHLIRVEGKPYSAELRNYDNMFKNNPSFSDHGEIMNYKKILSKACQEELKHYDVIFCTTAVATNWRFLKATQGKIFQMIIDEAGMCTEPETLAPIISSKAEQVVLIGDHKQLQPVVLCSEAASLGLEKSLFERYADQAVFLDCQYRMVSVMRTFELTLNN